MTAPGLLHEVPRFLQSGRLRHRTPTVTPGVNRPTRDKSVLTASWRRMVIRSGCNAELGGMAASLDTISPHLVAKRHHAVPICFDLRQMEGNISVEPLEERDAIANQDRQNRVAHFVGQSET